MVTVKFYGDLKRFSDEPITLCVDNFRELMSGLLTQINGLRQHLRNGFYKVRIGKSYLSEQQIKSTDIHFTQDCTVHFTPVIAGAGKAGGVLSVIAGVVLIVVGAVNQQWYLAGYGAGLLLGGAAMLMTKMPTMPNQVGNEGEKQQSTSFSNLRNLTPQGRPIPLLYGKMMTSLVLISQGVETFDEVSEAEKQKQAEARQAQELAAANKKRVRNTTTSSDKSTEREEKDRAEAEARERDRISREAQDLF